MWKTCSVWRRRAANTGRSARWDYLLVPVTVRASTGLNLRASASETAEKLLTIPNGTVVQCYGNKENEWARVAYNGKAGYVSYLYIAYD